MFSSIVRRNLLTKTTGLARFQKGTVPRATALFRQYSSDKPAEINVGPGARSGHTPTTFEQSTGDERAEHLAAMEGKDYYDLGPLMLTKKGTKTNPTIVPSGAESRIIGCTGAPGEDHELLWLVVEREHPFDRCPECGNVFKLSDKGFDPESLPEASHHHEH